MCGRENHALRIVHLAVALLAGSLALFASAPPARAVEAVRVSPDVQAIDLTPAIERYRSDGDEIRISTAPGRDGIVRRIAVKARETGTRPDWIVFALTNDTDEQLDRLLVAPHFRLVGSGVIWPDLGGSRIAAITASQGIRPEREDSTEADVFLMTLDPGTTVTFVAELQQPERAADLPLGHRQLPQEDHRAHPLQGHHHRHRRAARAVPDHRLRRQRGADLPGGGGARLGGACLCLHRFRLLPARLPGHRGGGADLPRRRRGGARGDAPRVPVRLSQPQPLARPLRPRHLLLAHLPGGARRPRGRRSAGRLRRRAHLDRGGRRRRLPPRRASRDPRLRSRRDAGADLGSPRRLGRRRRLHRDGVARLRPRAAGADRRRSC